MGKDNKPQISQQEVLDLFTYSDGKLWWKVSPAYRIKVGTEAGTVRKNGYRVVAYKGNRCRVHHLVYFMFTGVYPNQIDHVNTVRDDNRIENLREATGSENQWNRKIGTNNKTGFKNVKWVERIKRYMVSINSNNKCMRIGAFTNLELACLAATEARNLYHGKFARHQ